MAGIDFIRGYELHYKTGYTATSASFRHYNNFACFLVVWFFINFGFFNYSKNVLSKLAMFVLAGLIIGNLFFTYSRGAWFSFIFVCGLMVFFYPRRKVRIFFIFLGTIFSLIVFNIPSFWERLSFTMSRAGGSDRFDIWKTALMMFKDSPILGKGLGFFMETIRQYNLHIQLQYAHNCYIQLLAESGLIGLLTFLWLLFEVTRLSYRSLQDKFDFLFMGLFLALVAFLMNAFFDTQLFSLKSAILFWLLLSFVTINIPPEISKRKSAA